MKTFTEHLSRYTSAQEYFFPNASSVWADGEYRLDKKAPTERNLVGGVRLQPYDKSGEYPVLEKESQYDLKNLVKSLIHIRNHPEFSDVVISRRYMSSRQKGRHSGKRVRVGLVKADDFKNELAAARATHANLISIISRSGFKWESVQTFDPAKGLSGLLVWLDTLRLSTGINWRRPALLLLALLPLLFLLRFCDDKVEIGRMTVDSDNIIMIIDVSGSMSGLTNYVKNDVIDRIEKLNEDQGWFTSYSMEMLAFDHSRLAEAFGKIEPLTEESLDVMRRFVDNAEYGQSSGTLMDAVDTAIKLAKASGEDATILLFSDGGDDSLPNFLKTLSPNARSTDSGIQLHAISPRILQKPGPKGSAASAEEKNLEQLAKYYHGIFGGSSQKQQEDL